VGNWTCRDRRGNRLAGSGAHPLSAKPLGTGQWVRDGKMRWLATGTAGDSRVIGIEWDSSRPPTPEQQALLDDLGRACAAPLETPTRGTLDLVQKRIEEVQDATSDLQALRRFVSETLSQMRDGVLVLNTTGTVVLATPRAALLLLGDAQAQLSGRSILELVGVLQVHGIMGWAELWRRVLLEGEPVHFEARHHDGRDLLVQLAPLAPADRQFSGLVVNLSDVSPLKDSERKRSEVLGFLSHDLRAPLVSLLALIEIAKSKRPSADLLELIGRMESYTTNTLHLAEQFLQLAQAEAGDNIVFQEVELTGIALNALEQVWAHAEQKRITLEHVFGVDEAWFNADPGLLERALVNLLDNAIKYSPHGTKVTLTLSDRGHAFALCVTDQGPGVSHEELPRVFDRFHRTPAVAESDVRGTGLGLAFVRAVAEQHGGLAQAESRAQEGSRFCLLLPKHDH